MKKRIFAIILVSMMLALTACGGTSTANDVSTEEDYDANEEVWTEEKIEEAIQSYDTLVTYDYENSANGKKIVNIIEKEKKAEQTDYVYLEAKDGFFSGRRSYEETLEQTDYIYYGKIKDGKPDDYGILYYKESPVFIGEFDKGKKDGYGIKIAGDTLSGYYIAYEGEYKNGELEGKGREYNVGLTFAEDDYLFAVLLYEEEGLEYFPLVKNVLRYEGNFKNGKYHGTGTLYYTDGTVQYKGKFKKGNYCGTGTLYYADGTVQYKGKFKNGEYHGKGTLYYADGTVQYKGKFEKGDIE